MKALIFKIYYWLRWPLFKLKKNKIHSSARIGSNVLISHCTIGQETYVAPNGVFNFVDFGNYCSIAPGVQIGGMQHPYWLYTTSPRLTNKFIAGNRTKIGNDVWIGAGAIIAQGVKIGDGAVVGAMSFVNKDVAENTIVFGVPARFYKKRLEEEHFDEFKRSEYWLHPPHKAKGIIAGLKPISEE